MLTGTARTKGTHRGKDGRGNLGGEGRGKESKGRKVGRSTRESGTGQVTIKKIQLGIPAGDNLGQGVSPCALMLVLVSSLISLNSLKFYEFYVLSQISGGFLFGLRKRQTGP